MTDRGKLRERLLDCVNACNGINDVELADAIFAEMIASLKPVLGCSTIEVELLLGDLRRDIERQVEATTAGAVDLNGAIDDIVDELLGDEPDVRAGENGSRPARPRCDDCGRDFRTTTLAPMLRDEAWARFAVPHVTLCADCFFDRATERDIHLTLRDLRPCPFNLFDQPSWFAVFSGKEPVPPDLRAEWDAVGRIGTAEATRRST